MCEGIFIFYGLATLGTPRPTKISTKDVQYINNVLNLNHKANETH